MDLIDKLNELSNRIQRQRDSVSTEQAAKTAFEKAMGSGLSAPSEAQAQGKLNKGN